MRSLSLLSPAGLGPTVDGTFVDGFLAAQTEPALAAWMRRLVHDPAMLAPVIVRATLSAREDSSLVPAQRKVARAFFEGGTQLFSTTAALRAFPGACTVIVGREDANLSAAAPDGLVKCVFDAATERLIGAQIIGADASELIHGMTIAVTLGATSAQLAGVVFPHPTLSEALHEALHEAVLAAHNGAIHA